MKSNILYALADADFIFKKTLTDTIARSPFFKLSASANNGHELINAVRKHRLDIALVDLYMPVLSGIEAIKFIRLIDKNLPVICYSGTYQQDVAELTGKMNNVLYCEKKSFVLVDMLDAFFKEIPFNKTTYLEQWKKETTEKLLLPAVADLTPDFSATELRLIKLTYQGYTNKEIAVAMNLSNRTVDTYLNRLTEKLGLRSKLDLIRYAVEHGLYNTSW